MDAGRLVFFLLADRHGVPGRSRRPAPALPDAACPAIRLERLASRHPCGVSGDKHLAAGSADEPGPKRSPRPGRLPAADFPVAGLLPAGGSLILASRIGTRADEQGIDDANVARSLADQDRVEIA